MITRYLQYSVVRLQGSGGSSSCCKQCLLKAFFNLHPINRQQWLHAETTKETTKVSPHRAKHDYEAINSFCLHADVTECYLLHVYGRANALHALQPQSNPSQQQSSNKSSTHAWLDTTEAAKNAQRH
jgi:hypothetical protein